MTTRTALQTLRDRAQAERATQDPRGATELDEMLDALEIKPKLLAVFRHIADRLPVYPHTGNVGPQVVHLPGEPPEEHAARQAERDAATERVNAGQEEKARKALGVECADCHRRDGAHEIYCEFVGTRKADPPAEPPPGWSLQEHASGWWCYPPCLQPWTGQAYVAGPHMTRDAAVAQCWRDDMRTVRPAPPAEDRTRPPPGWEVCQLGGRGGWDFYPTAARAGVHHWATTLEDAIASCWFVVDREREATRLEDAAARAGSDSLGVQMVADADREREREIALSINRTRVPIPTGVPIADTSDRPRDLDEALAQAAAVSPATTLAAFEKWFRENGWRHVSGPFDAQNVMRDAFEAGCVIALQDEPERTRKAVEAERERLAASFDVDDDGRRQPDGHSPCYLGWKQIAQRIRESKP